MTVRPSHRRSRRHPSPRAPPAVELHAARGLPPSLPHGLDTAAVPGAPRITRGQSSKSGPRPRCAGECCGIVAALVWWRSRQLQPLTHGSVRSLCTLPCHGSGNCIVLCIYAARKKQAYGWAPPIHLSTIVAPCTRYGWSVWGTLFYSRASTGRSPLSMYRWYSTGIR